MELEEVKTRRFVNLDGRGFVVEDHCTALLEMGEKDRKRDGGKNKIQTRGRKKKCGEKKGKPEEQSGQGSGRGRS